MKDSFISFLRWLVCMTVIFTVLSACGVFVADHPPTKVIVKRGGTDEPIGEVKTAYSFKELSSKCTGCHNNSAPWIPLNEEDFKNSPKVKARTLNGTMPPSGGIDLEKASKYFNG